MAEGAAEVSLPESETKAEAVPATRRGRRPNPRIAQMKRTWYFLRRNTLAMVGIVILVIFIGIAIYALTQPIPWTQLQQLRASDGVTCASLNVTGCVCTYPAGSVAPGPTCYQTPSGYPSDVAPTIDVSHGTLGSLPLGSITVAPTNPTFYDIYAGLLRGSDWSLGVSVAIVGTGALIGLLVGAISGFFGGWVDEALMRIVDIFLSIPQILFVIIVIAVLVTLPIFQPFGMRVALLIVGFVIVWWPFYARIVRGQVLVVREQKYVEAAKASGAGGGRLVLRHIIPNSVYPIFVQMSLDVGTIPLLLGTLVYLGFPVFPTIYFPEWGSMAALSVYSGVGASTFTDALLTCQFGACVIPWWQFLFPGLMLFLYAISVNFLADGLRDALDPRLRR
ncbi:MAG TPA: ABC transporter permease [Thermoplasmata archaeon]|jgi:peptide/nickel transport system permease protein